MKFEELKKSQLLRIEAALVEVLEEAIQFCGPYTYTKKEDGNYEFSFPVSVFSVRDGMKMFEQLNKLGPIYSMRLCPATKDKMMLELTISEEVLLSLANK